MTYKLFLDDYRSPQQVPAILKVAPANEWIVVRSYDQAVDCILQNGMPDFISFDHDLNDDHYAYPNKTHEKTGMTFARWFIDWIIDNDIVVPDHFDYYVHSMNPHGAENIRSIMASFMRTI